MIESMAFVRGREVVATGTRDGMVSIWELDKQRSAVARRAMNNIITFRAHGGAVSALASSPDGKILGTASNDAIKIWETTNWKHITSLPVSGRYIRSMNFSDDGKNLFAIRGNDMIVTYAIDTGTEESSRNLVVPQSQEFLPLYVEPGAISENGEHAVTIKLYRPYYVQRAANEAIIWNGQSMEKERSLRTLDIIDVMRNRYKNIEPQGTAISSSANLVAVSLNQPGVYLYQLNSQLRVGVILDTPVHPPAMALSAGMGACSR